MSDTVRDAVFGNVGTMISFRVSADDSPILSKQFEPQFEPNDLLQMHNRNFIINMVINGEKAPAFSAKTLSLPPTQDDNTGRIIENTRNNYGQAREVIEASISDRIMPPDNLTVKRPGPAYTPPKSEEQREADRVAKEREMIAQGKRWPIEGITPDSQNTSLKDALQTAMSNKDTATIATSTPSHDKPPIADQPKRSPTDEPRTDNDSGEPRKKRSRSRKRKPSSDTKEQGSSRPSSTPPTPPSDPTTLRLR
jgi:hypothetical protein